MIKIPMYAKVFGVVFVAVSLSAIIIGMSVLVGFGFRLGWGAV
jgi:hypothetical protein